jgi:hypothetical protein
MAYPDDLGPLMANDHLVWNDTETITYFSKSSEAVPSSGTSVAGTLWLAIDKRYLDPQSMLQNMDLKVELPIANMKGIVAQLNDVMQRADGSRWVIKAPVETVATGNEYRVYIVQGTKKGD